MKRGEVWSAATGSGFGGKPRPVVLVNAAALLGLPVKLVVPLSSDPDDRSGLRPIVEPDPLNKLRSPSAAMVDVLIAVRHAKFGRKIGELTEADLARVDDALVAVLGLNR